MESLPCSLFCSIYTRNDICQQSDASEEICVFFLQSHKHKNYVLSFLLSSFLALVLVSVARLLDALCTATSNFYSICCFRKLIVARNTTKL